MLNQVQDPIDNNRSQLSKHIELHLMKMYNEPKSPIRGRSVTRTVLIIKQ